MDDAEHPGGGHRGQHFGGARVEQAIGLRGLMTARPDHRVRVDQAREGAGQTGRQSERAGETPHAGRVAESRVVGRADEAAEPLDAVAAFGIHRRNNE